MRKTITWDNIEVGDILRLEGDREENDIDCRIIDFGINKTIIFAYVYKYDNIEIYTKERLIKLNFKIIQPVEQITKSEAIKRLGGNVEII